MTEFEQSFHRDLQPATCWGYEGATPGPVIMVQRGQPIEVTWVNELRDESGSPRTTHYLDVDLCPHGAANEPRTASPAAMLADMLASIDRSRSTLANRSSLSSRLIPPIRSEAFSFFAIQRAASELAPLSESA